MHEWDKQLFVGEGNVFKIVVDLIDLKVLWSNGLKQVETKIKSSLLVS